MMLLMMLLTTASAWAFKTETTSYSISFDNSSGKFQIKAGSTVTASWGASTMGSSTIYWEKNETHQLANVMNIRPNQNVFYTSNSIRTDFNNSTTFTFTAPNSVAITSVVFKNGSNVVSGTNSANVSTYTVTLGKDTPFDGFEVTYGTISGSCGTNAKWTLSQQNGQYTVLTIGGSGAMTNEYSHDGASIWHTNAPWGYDLTSVTIENGITSIGQYAFCGCQSLATVTIGTGVTTIGQFAFNYCDALTQVTLPASVNSIGDQCFRNSGSLQRLNIQRTDGDLITLGSKVFNGCDNLQYIVAPTPMLALQYKTATNWKDSEDKLRAEFGGYVFYATNEGGTDAYAITSETDLRNLASAINADNSEGIANSKTFRQTGDITLSSDNYEPIGYNNYHFFNGTYDGGGYTISGLNVGSVSIIFYYGLFGYVKNGTVKNVRLDKPSVNGNGTTLGALIGKTDNATVKNCVVFNPTIWGSANNKGSIIGSISSSTLQNLYYYGGSYDAIGNNYSGTDAVRARMVTIGSGITSVTPAATDMDNGFVYDNDLYYREGLALTLTSNLSAPTGKHVAYKAINNAGEKKLNGNTYTVNSSDGDVTLTAELAYNTYTVHFNGNGGTCGDGQMTDQTFTYGTAQDLTANAFTRTGYTFASWNTKSNGTGTTYSDGQSVTNLTDTDGATVTLYAKWTRDEYAINYTLNGGELPSGQSNPATYNIETNTFTLINPTRMGYTFTGWTGSNGTTAQTTVTITKGTTTGTLTYTANWKRDEYAINYDLAGGELSSGQSNPATYNVETNTFTLINPTRTGYTFTGWTGSNGTTAQITVTITKGSTTGTLNYTANWTINKYTISFDTNGGTPATIDAIRQNYDTPISAPADPERTGYTFAGWNPPLPATMPAGDMTVTAQWTPTDYDIDYELNGGELPSGQSNPATYNVETNTFTLINPTRTGYTFAGWTEGNGTTRQTTVTIEKGSTTGALTYTAHWTLNTYTITYELDGGSVATANPTSYNVETPTFTLTNPTKENCHFVGWTEGDNNTLLPTVNITQGSTGNLDFTAHYKTNNFTVGEFSYQWTSGTEVKVTACNPSATSVTIPATVTNEDVIYSVTAIDASAFSGCTSLHAVILEADTPPALGSGAFSDCMALYAIGVPAGQAAAYQAANGWKAYADKIQGYDGTCGTNVYYAYNSTTKTLRLFGTGAMADYTSSLKTPWYSYHTDITTVVIAYGVTSIGFNAFIECTSLTSIEIPASVTSIGQCSFQTCTSLTSITIPASVTSIGIQAFNGCTSLTSITIPASVTSIGQYAFWNCTNLRTVILGSATPPSLGLNAFYGCTSLNVIGVPSGSVEAYKAAERWNAYASMIRATDGICGADGSDVYYAYDSSTKTLTIFGAGAMADYDGTNMPWYNNRTDIKTVVIAYGVTSIGDDAFYGCTGLTNITIPASVTSIGNRAFSGCTSLLVVFLESDTPSALGTNAFSGCTALDAIYVPAGTAETYQAADGWKDYAGKIRAADGTYGDNVYYAYDSTTKTLYIFGTGDMKNYNGLNMPWDNYRTAITTVVIGHGVTYIGSMAFNDCTGLTSIEIPASVTGIGHDAFSGCTSLASIEIPASVTKIGEMIFSGCTSLASIEIPASVTSIGRFAFENCTGLTSIEIPASVTSIESNPFWGCSSLKTISVASGNTVFDSRNNCNAIIRTKTNTLIIGCKNSVIPNGVTIIDDDAFNGCTGLTSIDIPASVTTINMKAFLGCTGLTSIEIPASVTRIGSNAFGDCTGLTSIEIPASVTRIDNYAFRDCTDLTAATIYAPELSYYGIDAFKGNASGRKIYVFKNCVGTYQSGWSNYASDIQAIEDISLQDNDDNSALIAAASGNALGALDVTLQGRTLYKDGAWNTLCLPFDVTVGSGQMAGATAMTLNGSTSGFNASTGELTLNFAGVALGSTITAGTPFIVKWTGTDVTNPVFSGVTVSSTTPGSVTSTDGYVTFIGTYSPVPIYADPATNLYLGAGNKLYYPSSAKDINSFRAYFKLNNGLTAGTPDTSTGVRAFVLNFGNEETTGIIDIEHGTLNIEHSADAGWYDLSGRKLSGKPTKKGLYIHNGRKIAIK